ncbi:hypothetical protein LIER_40540 [Lithospermum erythrorhizon]|uniref:Uncharacterized protein n=1 Tax=Lithospermum erythrorhizon TaxID=34254 RepID=A0AAV3QZT2_LITER
MFGRMVCISVGCPDREVVVCIFMGCPGDRENGMHIDGLSRLGGCEMCVLVDDVTCIFDGLPRDDVILYIMVGCPGMMDMPLEDGYADGGWTCR